MKRRSSSGSMSRIPPARIKPNNTQKEASMKNEAEVNEYAAKQLRTIRAASGLSQTKLAWKMNISPQQVQKYEWGINRLSIGRLMQYAAAFDVPVATFFPNSDK